MIRNEIWSLRKIELSLGVLTDIAVSHSAVLPSSLIEVASCTPPSSLVSLNHVHVVLQKADSLLLGDSKSNFESVSFLEKTPFSVVLGSIGLDGLLLVLPGDIGISGDVSSCLS